MAVKKSLQIVAEQASLEAKQKKKKSGKVFEANCSKQMGLPKKLIFNQTSLCGMAKVQVSAADHICHVTITLLHYSPYKVHNRKRSHPPSQYSPGGQLKQSVKSSLPFAGLYDPFGHGYW